MDAIFYAAGPGLRKGVEVAPMRQIDIAPTLAHLLGVSLPAPRDPRACGTVLTGALVENSQ